MTIDPRLKRIVAGQPYPLLFATISGAHLYGFPSPDSDFDLRGAHVLPLDKVVGLEVQDETIESAFAIDENSSLACRAEAEVDIETGSGELRRDSLRRVEIGGGRRLEMDIVSHDVKKFFGMLKKNGYVLEQLFSPLVVHTTPEHEELKAICSARLRPGKMVSTQQPSPGAASATPPSPAPAGEGHTQARAREIQRAGSETGAPIISCPGSPSATSPRPSPPFHGGEGGGSGVITKHHAHHYFGFAETQWKLFVKESPRRVKPLLYVYRVLLTGIHLMRTGDVEANIVTLNESFRLPYIGDLVARKLAGTENLAVGQLLDSELAFHEAEYHRLRAELQSAYNNSHLPELPSEETRAALNDLLVRIRLK